MADILPDLRISNRPSPQPSARILNSWKEIAAYLGRGVRTIQRYEEKLGLPVHRPASRERSSVVAFSDELERWLRNSPSRNGTFLNSADGHQPSPMSLEAPQLKKTVQTELERAKREMEEAHAAYQKSVERYRALKRRCENGNAQITPEKLKRVG